MITLSISLYPLRRFHCFGHAACQMVSRAATQMPMVSGFDSHIIIFGLSASYPFSLVPPKWKRLRSASHRAPSNIELTRRFMTDISFKKVLNPTVSVSVAGFLTPVLIPSDYRHQYIYLFSKRKINVHVQIVKQALV